MWEQLSSQTTEQASTARHQPPHLPTGLVWRGRLIETIDAGVSRGVTLICAGPGWGKTVLAASWATARALSGPVVWLTVNRQHNDPDLFWADLNRSLETAGITRAPVTGETDPRRAFIRALVQTATVTGAPVVVLDELQEITNSRILSALAVMLDSAPRLVRFVLVSRRDPRMLLHRLRIAGALTEVSTADLAFRADEAGELLALRGDRQPPEELTTLARDAEGWAVGLRLAADVSPSAGADALTDYLAREVLNQQPAEVRRFLLRTSVSNRICADLADALAGDANGHRMLETLLRENLLMEPVGNGRWFRYHPMFRAFLRRRAAGLSPEETARLHLAAARWYAAAGDTLAALTHAATAEENWDVFARLVVERGLSELTSANRPQMVELLSRIPPALLPTTPELAVCAAVTSFARGDLAAVPGRLAHARALLDEQSSSDRPQIEAALSVIEAGAVLRWRGDMPHLAAAATALLAELSRMGWDQAPSVLQYRAITLNNKAFALLWGGWSDHADRYLWAAATAARIAELPYVEINSLGHLACLAFFQGSLREAGEHVEAAVALARRIDADGRISVAPAYLAQALIETERGRMAEAEEALRRALHALGDMPETVMGALAGLVRARLKLDRGEAGGSRALLARIRTEAGPALVAPYLDRLIAIAEAEVELALGDPAAVVTRYAGQSDLLAGELVCLARARLATGRPDAAEQAVARVRDGADRVAGVSGWLLTALGADKQGRSTAARDALSRAFAAAEPDQIRRPFRGYDAHRVLALAERQPWLTDPAASISGGFLGEITAELPVIRGGLAGGPLSGREVDVLQYLPTVLTAAEIAASLCISVNTVKAHMRSIYRKLGAARRREAVVLSRQAGLI